MGLTWIRVVIEVLLHLRVYGFNFKSEIDNQMLFMKLGVVLIIGEEGDKHGKISVINLSCNFSIGNRFKRGWCWF